MPLVVRSGNLQGTIILQRSGDSLRLELEKCDGRSLVFTRGPEGNSDLLDFSISAKAIIPPGSMDGAGTLLEQLQGLQITSLGGYLGSANNRQRIIAEFIASEPVVIRRLSAPFDASGEIRCSGQVRLLANLLEALQGVRKDSLYNYSGSYSFKQKLATQQKMASLNGEFQIIDFAVGNENAPTLREPRLRLDNEVNLLYADKNSKPTLLVNRLSFDMQETRALSLFLKGKVTDANNERKLEEFGGTLDYDSAKLLELVRPFMPDDQVKQLKTLKASGVVKDREIKISGKFPVDPGMIPRTKQQRSPFWFVNAQTSLLFENVEYLGMAAQDVEIPIFLDKGIIRTSWGDAEAEKYAPPAKFSGGTLDLGGLELNFLAAHPRITALRKNYKLLDNVAINEQFADSYLGSWSPLFATVQKAKGPITVTLNQLDRLPLDEELSHPKKNDPGAASVDFSIADLRVQSAVMKYLADVLKLKVNPDGTISGEIKDAKMSVADGKVTSDINLNLGGQILGNKGSLRLRDQQLVGMVMTIPTKMIPFVRDQRLPILKDVISVPVEGPVKSPKIDIIGAATKSLAPEKLLPNLPNLLNPKK